MLPRVFILTLLSLCVLANAMAETQAWAKVVRHKDGKVTESKVDPVANTLEQITKSESGTVSARRVFTMDSKGRIRHGLIFDGKQQLLARIDYGFDDYDRINEERMFHSKGPLIRRAIYKYDASGRRLPSKAYLYNPAAPQAAPTEEDNTEGPVVPITPGNADTPGLGIPQFRGLPTTQAPVPVQPAVAPKSKPGFFNRLLNK